ncbi:hypothetical protein M5K25_001153 [Dendrobium thyrsiflorum]|uniref:Uncharacterized protein n=1 Tax=Dendrobium thyrsiflorum TaxID=117978 RepID=A0ABD0VVL2_DENTH
MVQVCFVASHHNDYVRVGVVSKFAKPPMQNCSIRAPMTGRKVEVLEKEIGQLKSDCVEKNLDFKKLFSAIHEKIDKKFAIMEEMIIHEKIDKKFAIMEEMVRKILEFQTKTASPEARGATSDHGSGGNPNPIRRWKDQDVEMLGEEEGMPLMEPLLRRGKDEGG